MKNKTPLFIISFTVAVALLVIILYTSLNIEKPIGGERDEYGCLGPAGYTWNKTDQLCVREWTREECPEERGDFCITVYEPVCGLPTKKQYSNSCFACLDLEVKQFVDGECQ